ncbi:MAG: glycosyltransferase, partial [Leptolyngbyaceae cyanobacterium bins.59]|nr:glycosyltransferase [Leptolyngbyaceae cyanobacterium bins.59]
LVDLQWGSHAGGHVKCWERFAEAARTVPELDLTVYYLGPKQTEVTIAPNVRYQLLPPLLGTDKIPFLRERSRDTDLAPYYPALAKFLRRHDVLHTTSAFTFSRTAHRVARKQRIPIVSSTHTDLPEFTRIYSRQIISRVVGQGWLNRLLFDRWKLDEFLAQDMKRQWCSLMGQSDWVLLSKPEDSVLVEGVVPPERTSRLRRGIDPERFHPKHRDRSRLQAQFGIPPEVPVLLFVGRVDETKKVMTMAIAARHLLGRGMNLHTLIIGEGSTSPTVQNLLQTHVTLPGVLPQEDLAWIYASSDLFVFPSESEVSPNVVLEARTSGLPVFVSARDGGAKFVQQSGVDGVVVSDPHPNAWAEALLPYLEESDRRHPMSLAARRCMEEQWPSWETVLREDLLSIWEKVSHS